MNEVIESIIGTLERDDESADLRIQAALELAYGAETSLARRDARVKAEALESLLFEAGPYAIVPRARIASTARGYRRQAE